MRKIFFSAIMMMAIVVSAMATNVTVTMNAVSKTMKLVNKSTGVEVAVGSPTSNKYSFTADAGTYVLTGYDTDGTTVNGTIELTVGTESVNFVIQTATLGFSNTGFEYGTDVTLELNLKDANGTAYDVTIGDSKTAGKKTFLVFKGSKTSIVGTPSAARAAEGFQVWNDTQNRTHNSNATIWVALPQKVDYTITVPADANAQLATKDKDYIPFVEIVPTSVTTEGTNKVYHYDFTLTTSSTTLMYRIWGDNYCTQAGTLSKVLGMENLVYTAADLQALSPKYINHDVTANGGYNVADVFVNVNPQGHLKMQVGDKKDITALRTWQLTNNSTTNMYVDPTYHFKVVNLNGVEDNSVISLERYTTSTDPWTKLTAVGNGTAIVLVTYDALQAVIIDKATKTDYMGGKNWSAIWPENTGVFVVTVGDADSGIKSNMFANKGTNTAENKLAVDTLDAEHDVIYYLASEGHADYTFTPEGVTKVEIAYPTIGTNSASYSTFEEVTKADDGSYTLQLKGGRNIVRLTNASNVSDYQVITAKPCTREITNLSRPGKNFRAGDKVSIQYAGLFHPNNKLSRIYNMSAYVTYNGIPSGASMVGSSSQYNFASTPAAQLYKYNIALDAAGEVVLGGGCIQMTGYGDPVGNQRNLDRIEGRVYSGAALSRIANLGYLPEIKLDVEGLNHHKVVFTGLPSGAKVYVMNDAKDTLVADTDGSYDVIYGAFTYSVEAENYAPLHSAFTVSMSQKEQVEIKVNMTLASAAWDGTTKTEPTKVGDVYQIATGAELAWLAETANAATTAINAVLTADINLGGKEWTVIGTSANPYLGVFDGKGHTICGLNVNATTTYQGLFGKLKNGTIKDLIVEGNVVTTSTHAAGIVGGIEAGTLENVHFRGTVNTGKNNTGGIVGFVNGANASIVGAHAEGYIFGAQNTGGIVGNLSVATDKVTDSYNWAFVSGTGLVGGIAGTCNASSLIKDVYNAGVLQMRGVSSWSGMTYAKTIGAICGLAAYGALDKGYATEAYENESNAANKTIVLGYDTCADGTIAHKFGWGQEMGVDPYALRYSDKQTFQVNYNEQGKPATVLYFNAQTLGELWFGNTLGWYHNAANDTVREISQDTTLYANVALKPLTGAATFDERTFKSETVWQQDPDFVIGFNAWKSGDYTFTTDLQDWSMWGLGVGYSAFSMSNVKDAAHSYAFHSAANKAAQGDNYAVMYYDSWSGGNYVTLASPAVVSGAAVTNTSNVVNAFKNGDGQSDKFDYQDYFALLCIGSNAGTITDTVTFYLADFRAAGVGAKWKYAENWQWVDLTALGAVDKIEFVLKTTKENAYGATTPMYFCLDNFGGVAADCQLGAMTEIDATTTDIINTENEDVPALKLLQNGNIYILREGVMYNMQGMRIQ